MERMSTKSSDCLTAVPGPDESILAALTEIDQKLTLWSEAMGRAQTAIADRARALLEQEHSGTLSLGCGRSAATQDDPGMRPNPSAADERTTPADADAGNMETHVADASTPEVVSAIARRLGDDSIDHEVRAADRTAAGDGAVDAPTEFEAIGEPVDEEVVETTPISVVHPDDDESLLAGLDPQVAKAIKVKRRLLEGVKTLRQLVEEHKAQGGREDVSKAGKKSWWSRG